jgi:hypothetical protein
MNSATWRRSSPTAACSGEWHNNSLRTALCRKGTVGAGGSGVTRRFFARPSSELSSNTRATSQQVTQSRPIARTLMAVAQVWRIPAAIHLDHSALTPRTASICGRACGLIVLVDSVRSILAKSGMSPRKNGLDHADPKRIMVILLTVDKKNGPSWIPPNAQRSSSRTFRHFRQ